MVELKTRTKIRKPKEKCHTGETGKRWDEDDSGANREEPQTVYLTWWSAYTNIVAIKYPDDSADTQSGLFR